MNINTSQIRALNTYLSPYIRHLRFKNLQLQSQHNEILQKLKELSTFITTSASHYEMFERSMFFTSPTISTKDNTLTYSWSKGVDWRRLIKKDGDTSYINGSMEYSYREIGISSYAPYSSFDSTLKLGNVRARGEAQVTIFKDGKVDPKAEIDASLQMSLLSGTMSARMGTKDVYAYGKATGSVGTAYGNAHAVFSKDEQTLEMGLGVAALRGEVQGSFHFFGANITVTGEGTVGSAEANISYHHSAKEWEFGSKLGFIAGLGFKVRVSY